MAVAVSADKRFRRAHVAPSRRRAWRTAGGPIVRAVVAAALAAGALSWAWYSVTSAPALAVRRVSVGGETRMALGDVLALTDELKGENMVSVDLEAWRQRLLRLPWVEQATMRRVFPGTVQIFISERRPMGIGRLGDDLYLVDAGGIVIDEFGPQYAGLDLPIIDGLGAGNLEGAAVDASRAVLAGRLLAQLERRPDLARRVSQIDVSDVRDAAVTLRGDTAVLRVGDDAFVERLQSYIELAPTLIDRVQAIDYVDLRFDERVYVKPRAARPAARRPAPAGPARRGR